MARTLARMPPALLAPPSPPPPPPPLPPLGSGGRRDASSSFPALSFAPSPSRPPPRSRSFGPRPPPRPPPFGRRSSSAAAAAASARRGYVPRRLSWSPPRGRRPPAAAAPRSGRTFTLPPAFASFDEDADDAFLREEEDWRCGAPRIRPLAAAGLTEPEASAALGAAASFCDEEGIPFGFAFGSGGEQVPSCEAAVPESVVGATGRVLLLGVDGGGGEEGEEEGEPPDEEWLLAVKYGISERLDEAGMDPPVLVAFRPGNGADEGRAEGGDGGLDLPAETTAAVEEEVDRYSLREPVSDVHREDDGPDGPSGRFVPSVHVEIDGAYVDVPDGSGARRWDASSVLVFDGLVHDSLRGRLLDVVLGRSEGGGGGSEGGGEGGGSMRWDDVNNGPDPSRWERGGLLDIPDASDDVDEGIPRDDDDDGGGGGPCWGLRHDAILDLCEGSHPALLEFESLLTRLFPAFVVGRLPEAVLGSSVSPLTANAPTFGDAFSYHVDADPNLAPPSPWTDVYGRYPNRSPGKPRFVSVLVYLNDVWEREWGAPTRFLDPPTGDTYDVIPRSGRVVVLDQDVSHTVVPPNAEAGRGRPRYSLVWKLVLHPKSESRGCADLSCGREEGWPDPTPVGSAAGGSDGRQSAA